MPDWSTVFERAREHVLDLMKKNLLVKFLHSKEYARVVASGASRATVTIEEVMLNPAVYPVFLAHSEMVRECVVYVNVLWC